MAKFVDTLAAAKALINAAVAARRDLNRIQSAERPRLSVKAWKDAALAYSGHDRSVVTRLDEQFRVAGHNFASTSRFIHQAVERLRLGLWWTPGSTGAVPRVEELEREVEAGADLPDLRGQHVLGAEGAADLGEAGGVVAAAEHLLLPLEADEGADVGLREDVVARRLGVAGDDGGQDRGGPGLDALDGADVGDCDLLAGCGERGGRGRGEQRGEGSLHLSSG